MTRNPSDPQGGLPDDAGNGMSERSGYTGDSVTGMTDTPVGSGAPSERSSRGDQADSDGSGTTFDGGSAMPER
ncbi:hypothetical protein [Deinococcus koreensis]|uniref:Uncharacterized protein n=1 Tax=Deinococcus koreensis TaxID=2054903 RepID=A0A2K3UV73_9DEIO|nr:hypothetical protein [Deinococcus koreensis]PNY80428.1 hypothetical protein CVO96_02730 [Deinococcus koreensis]